MIRKLRTQRDNQQWMLDLALNMRGRVQNFERDDLEVPAGKRARNYRMLPKVWREAAERHEALARRAQARGANETATYHYDHAIEAYRMAQHPIYFDDHPVKIELYRKLVRDGGPPLEGRRLPDRARRGAVRRRQDDLLPAAPAARPPQGAGGDLRAGHGPDQGGVSRRRIHNIALSRGFHVLAMDGPGQGSSNMQKIRAVRDNYERAGAAVISYLAKRPGGGPEEDRDLRHQHGQLLVAAALELRPPRGGGGELGRVLQPEQHDLHAVLAALQADVHVHGGLRRRGEVRRGSREAA